ncbi:rhomboid family intramembrane serine protease [Planctomicrobium sp. SH668]|uniref:rhomboid family intramembrane serine protease n=1 Tax=Planctomicrobium sp. SH668 TaxID=3448126 RepID=UPI003F5AFD4F
MGISNRDYMGGSSRPWDRASGGGQWSMVTTLIVINIVVFVLQLVTARTGLLESWFRLSSDAITSFQLWRLVTFDFLHDASSALPFHLLFNMLLLYVAGSRVEAKYGSREFLALYLISGVSAALLFLLWNVITGSDSTAIGASGSVVAIMIVYAMNWPREVWNIWGILPIPVYIIAIIAVVTDVLPMLQELGGQVVLSRAAHAAHIGGMIFGYLYVRYQWEITSFLGDWNGKSLRRMFQSRPKLKVHIPDGDSNSDLDADGGVQETNEEKLDRLLMKISEQSEASLTSEERQFLADTSRRFRNRRS